MTGQYRLVLTLPDRSGAASHRLELEPGDGVAIFGFG